jgi:hypothetical protein
MAEPSPDKIVIGIVGSLIGAAIGWLPGGLTGSIGAPLTTLLAAVGGIGGLVFSLMYKRYIGVLGAGGGRKGYPARDAYEAIRTSLSGGNLASRLYADWLTKFLDAVDRFFGDAGMVNRTFFPRAFGLKTPAPLWTAPAFDRCLLLALVYPIVIIFIIWAVSGHVGPAEAALGLKANLAGWRRGLAVGYFAVSIVSVQWVTWMERFTGAISLSLSLLLPLSPPMSLLSARKFSMLPALVLLAASLALSLSLFFSLSFGVALSGLHSSLLSLLRCRLLTLPMRPFSLSRYHFCCRHYFRSRCHRPERSCQSKAATRHLSLALPFRNAHSISQCGNLAPAIHSLGRKRPSALVPRATHVDQCAIRLGLSGRDARAVAARARTWRMVALSSCAHGRSRCGLHHRASRHDDGDRRADVRSLG